MFTKYNEYDLLELFESEPVIIGPKEAGMSIYSKSDDRGITFVLSLSIYENRCCLGLNFKDRLVFETTLHNVEYLHSEDNGEYLRIHQKESDQDYLVYFKPIIFIKKEV